MKLVPKQIKAKEYDIVLRSPDMEEASKILAYLKKVFAESEFLSMYPEELTFTVRDEENFIRSHEEAKQGFLMGAYHGDILIGMLNISKKSSLERLSHRLGLGISLKKEYRGLGIGKSMLEYAISMCRESGIEMILLEVYENNHTARHLYESLGFEKIGVIKNGYKLRGERYADEILMAYYI